MTIRLRTNRLGALLTAATVSLTWLGIVTGAQVHDDTDDARLIHLLNRTTFGPRPGDLERLREMGVASFIEEQLHPSLIDDSALERRLSEFETLELDTATIVRSYHLPAQMARRARRAASQMKAADERGTRRDMPPEVRRGQLPLRDLGGQKLVRAVSSRRQLQEVLVDFWFNHFNVSARKGPLIQPFVVEYERDIIRPHVLGRFRVLLGAVAKSPAMLIYLDNWLSSDPDADRETARRSRRRRQTVTAIQPGRRNGLNENYARELLELHTLGVDGGYVQADVVRVAEAFTGWTVSPVRHGGGYTFASFLHMDGTKTVLGAQIDGDGRRDGEEVLDLLSRHPSTARFIVTKLASRFVADDPPSTLVDRAT